MAISQKEEYTISVQNTTPLLIGWYDPTLPDPLGVRASEIKGLWHWWARAFIAGALYDLGLLQGRGTGDIVLKPTQEEAELIACIVGRVLGLGYAGEEAEASRFTIYTEYLEKPSAKLYRDELQRIRLLTLGRRKVYGYPPRHIFKIAIKKRLRKYDYAETTALKILVAALQLSGVGKGGRRGLGSLDMKQLGIVREKELRDFIESIYVSCTEISNKVVEGQIRECENIVHRFKKFRASRASLPVQFDEAPPPLPCVSKKNLGNIPVTQIFIAKNIKFPVIHNFFVRSERCRVLTGSSKCDDMLRKSVNAWILGLPRRQSNTGYVIKSKEISRRASPIIVSNHERFNVFGEGVYVSILLSADWPKKLEWFSTETSKIIEIDLNRLYNAYSTALNVLMDYLKKVNANIVQVWP